jgi:hypothetical protein
MGLLGYPAPVSLNTSESASDRAPAEVRTLAGNAVPWYIWCSAAAVTSVMLGGYWDISWHMSIGRDTFWTPAHLLIYLCGILAGISCGFLIFSTTWNHRSALREASVAVWGFRAPLGAFIAVWGSVAMLTSAPFDNWWHNAYGLDVKILSPPHAVLDTGILAIEVGSLVLIAGALNRAQGQLRRKLMAIFLYLGGMMVMLALTVVWDYTYRVNLHSARAYEAVAALVPLVIFGMARASGHRWALTIVTGVYCAYAALMMWILPLFPAQPKLGPVYRPVTHYVPLDFPLLVIVPALVIDWLWPRVAHWGKGWQAVVLATLFVAAYLAAEWPFADFLMSPASRNWLFGTNYFPYMMRPNAHAVQHVFYYTDPTPAAFWLGIAQALALAIAGTRLGMAWGDWMRRVKR